MRLITGDECGLIKECIPELGRKIQDKSAALSTFGAMAYVTSGEVAVQRINRQDQQTRQYGIIDMTYLSSDDGNDDHDLHNFATLRKDGRVEIWEGNNTGNKKHKKKKFGSYQKVATTKNLFTSSSSSSSSSEDDEKTNNNDNEEIRPLGLGYYPNSNRICAGDMSGNITIAEATGGRNNIVETYNAYQSTKRGKTISYTPGKFVNKQLATAISFDAYNNRVAVGGRERETTLLDLSTGKTVFKAKNLPPDPQTLLQQPVWPSSILFMGDTTNNVMAVGTAYKEIRLYDCRQDTKTRRPTSLTPEGLFDYRITALCRGSNEHQLIVGDTAGNIYNLDTRILGRDPKKKSNKNLGRYVGPAGSIRQIQKHPTLPLVAAVGLDRMLRIYDIHKRNQLDCVYLKQRLNCVLFGSDDTWGGTTSNDDDDDDDDDDRHNKENDDYDIDQDDMVEDYVDSDNDSEKESGDDDNEDEDPAVGGGNDDIVSREDNESSSSNDDDDDEEEEIVDKSDDSSQDDDDDDDDSSSSSNQSQDERSGSSSDDDDEEIVIKAPTKKRRRR